MSHSVSRPSLRERIRQAPKHTGGEFEEHLEGTASLVRAWGRSAELERAARHHSVYGNFSGRAPIAEREEVAAEIGAPAEQLVWLWSVADRDSLGESALAAAARGGRGSVTLALADGGAVEVPAAVALDLAHLHAANSLEMAIRSGKPCTRLDALRPALCPEAVALVERHGRRRGLFSRWRERWLA